MDVCAICNLGTLYATSCIKRFEGQIPYGKETISDWYLHFTKCATCGVSEDGYHHKNCDIEECPECYGRYSFCGCNLES